VLEGDEKEVKEGSAGFACGTRLFVALLLLLLLIIIIVALGVVGVPQDNTCLEVLVTAVGMYWQSCCDMLVCIGVCELCNGTVPISMFKLFGAT
jgi:hypothetical protein